MFDKLKLWYEDYPLECSAEYKSFKAIKFYFFTEP